LAYELSQACRMLLMDTCSQRNFSQNIFGDALMDFRQTLYDALVVEITNAGNFDFADSTINVKGSCLSFLGNKATFMLPGKRKKIHR
jgi:cellulose biosynthesis protein BcsQ